MKKTVLTPIVRQEKKLVNSWCGNIQYLQDLKAKKGSMINLLQNEIIVLYQSINQNKELEVKQKIQGMLQSSDAFDKISTLTGFEDAAEQAISLFQILAMLEMQAQAYLDADLYCLANNFQMEKSSKDRLLSYLQLLTQCKKQKETPKQVKDFKSSREEKKQISINCANTTGDIIQLLEESQGSLISPELIHMIHDIANNSSTNNRSFSSTMLSSKLTSYTSSTDEQTLKIDELKDKLRISQEAVHERNKQIREKDKIIEELNRRMLAGDKIQPIVMPEVIYKPSDSALQEVIQLKNQVKQLYNNEQRLEQEIKFLLEQLDKAKNQPQQQAPTQQPETSNDLKSLQSKHQQALNSVLQDKQSLESEKRQFEIKLYEKQAEFDQLKQELIQNKISCQGHDSELILVKDNLQQTQEELLKTNALIDGHLSDKKNLEARIIELQSSQQQNKNENDMIQNLKDQISQMQKLIESKNNQILDLQSQVRQAIDSQKDFKLDIENLQQQKDLLENVIRDFNESGSDNFEETYEAVLRSEFELMRSKFEKQVSFLKQDLQDQFLKHQIQMKNLVKEIDEVKVQRDAYSSRLTTIRLLNQSQK